MTLTAWVVSSAFCYLVYRNGILPREVVAVPISGERHTHATKHDVAGLFTVVKWQPPSAMYPTTFSIHMRRVQLEAYTEAWEPQGDYEKLSK